MPDAASPTASPRRATWRRALDLAIWIGVGVMLVVLWMRITPPSTVGEPMGPAADFSGTLLDGTPFRLADYAGQVVVLNFWATWCPPCHAETPGFVRLQRDLEIRGVQFVGVSVDVEGAEVVGPFAERYGVNYPMVLHGQSVGARYGGISAYPTTFVIDRAGQIRLRHEGFLLASALRPTLETLARERAPR